jgi:hypothetical protein
VPDLEAVSRWLANRTTRRSFLGKVGRGAVLVASGSALATLVVGDEAQARVCGQSGVSPKCPTYDCDDEWGWCWYATGCCAGGELKKICDCCRLDHPNVHGYCPSGHNVYCIVESCGADPRVQVVALRRVPSDDAVLLSTGASRARFGDGSAKEVWLVEAGQTLAAAVTAPMAAKQGLPLLLARGNALGAHLIAELQRLGATKVVLRGSGFLPTVDAELVRYGITVEHADPDGSVAGVTAVADRFAAEQRAAGVRRAVCVEAAGMSGDAAPLAAGLAMAKGYPLVIGVDRAKAAGFVLTYLVGPEAAARAEEVPGGQPLSDGSWAGLSAKLADVAYRAEGSSAPAVAMVADGGPSPAGLVTTGGPILVHEPGSVGGVRDVLFTARDRIRSIVLGGATGALTTDGYYELQSIVNGFEAHKLIGVSGQGLPVIDQPVSERPLGLARRSNTPPVELAPQYWTGRGLELDG